MNNRNKVISILYKKNWTKLHIHAYNLIGDDESAKDIVNDVFCMILEKDDVPIDDPKSILPLLLTMVKNKCIDFLRHKNVIQKNEKSYIEDLYGGWTKEDYIIYEKRISDIQKKIDNMAPQMRKVVEEFFINNKKCSEISTQLSISDNTVRTHIARAMKIFRKQILSFF